MNRFCQNSRCSELPLAGLPKRIQSVNSDKEEVFIISADTDIGLF